MVRILVLMSAAAAVVLPVPARADCAADIARLREGLSRIQPEDREHVRNLLANASVSLGEGDEQECLSSVEQAQRWTTGNR